MSLMGNGAQSAVLVLTLAAGCLLMTSGATASGSSSADAYDTVAAGSRFIAARAARAAAARSAPDGGSSRLTVRAARAAAAAARAARAAAASESGPAAQPAAYYPGLIEEDAASPDLYWAALDAHSAAGADVVPVYKWVGYESRAARSQSGQPKRTGNNRKFQTQGW